MTKIAIAVSGVLLVFALFMVWYSAQQEAAERRGVEAQVARDISKANQELAVKRERDAKFDKMDARAFCVDAGLDWVFEDGKSFCR